MARPLCLDDGLTEVEPGRATRAISRLRGHNPEISRKPVSGYLHGFRHSSEMYLTAEASRVMGLSQADPGKTRLAI